MSRLGPWRGGEKRNPRGTEAHTVVPHIHGKPGSGPGGLLLWPSPASAVQQDGACLWVTSFMHHPISWEQLPCQAQFEVLGSPGSWRGRGE